MFVCRPLLAPVAQGLVSAAASEAHVERMSRSVKVSQTRSTYENLENEFLC